MIEFSAPTRASRRAFAVRGMQRAGCSCEPLLPAKRPCWRPPAMSAPSECWSGSCARPTDRSPSTALCAAARERRLGAPILGVRPRMSARPWPGLRRREACRIPQDRPHLSRQS
jgi:hypothetical protein